MFSLMLVLLSGQVVAAGTLAGIALQMRRNLPEAALVKVPVED
jgi:hypothetical protein